MSFCHQHKTHILPLDRKQEGTTAFAVVWPNKTLMNHNEIFWSDVQIMFTVHLNV